MTSVDGSPHIVRSCVVVLAYTIHPHIGLT